MAEQNYIVLNDTILAKKANHLLTQGLFRIYLITPIRIPDDIETIKNINRLYSVLSECGFMVFSPLDIAVSLYSYKNTKLLSYTDLLAQNLFILSSQADAVVLLNASIEHSDCRTTLAVAYHCKKPILDEKLCPQNISASIQIDFKEASPLIHQ